ncbi:MAG: ATP-binding protein, partial [Candidatus Bathyarchaeia archaeon]
MNAEVANMDRIGVILEVATPRGFLFRVEAGESVPLHEYISTEVVELVKRKRVRLQVLAEVVSVEEKDPLATEHLVGQISAYGYELGRGEILGYLQNGRIFRPKSAPKPNTPVYRASNQMLTGFFGGDNSRLPIEVGSLLNRPQVKIPVHIQDLQFHLGIFAQTRAGKSYFAGKVIEEILRNTPFSVVVIDIHGDYLMMDRSREDDQRHGEYNVVVYYPRMRLRVDGVTAREENLALSPRDIGYPILQSLLPGLGDRQRRILRDIFDDLNNQEAFGLEDIIGRVRGMEEDPDVDDQTRTRCTGILDRLELLRREIDLLPTGISIMDLLRPSTLSIICLRGLSAFVQDIYSALIVDMIYKNQVRNSGDLRRAPPVFVFVEEAHRVAAK